VYVHEVNGIEIERLCGTIYVPPLGLRIGAGGAGGRLYETINCKSDISAESLYAGS
jgi:hypothetical protein